MTSPIIRRALISTSNKTGLVPFAEQLYASGIEIIATGGTANLLTDHHIPVRAVSDFTQFPEIMGGRVKTLHPKIYGGLLRRPGQDDAVILEHDIEPIDLLIVNLYPFQATIADPHCPFEKAVEQIDIGGPAMLRAAAKNHAVVTVVVDPNDYPVIIAEIQQHHHTQYATRRHLAQKAFAHTSQYDAAISHYLARQDHETPVFPEIFAPVYEKKMELRYGENPHQGAALYRESPSLSHSLTEALLLQGKPLSFNNLVDSDAALHCVSALDPQQPACVIVKHATPCGAAQGATLLQAYQKALATDPTSAFGGIIAVNQALDLPTAQTILAEQFVEVLLVPEMSADILALFQHKPALRILACGYQNKPILTPKLHYISGGLLLQDQDYDQVSPDNWQIVTQQKPQQQQMSDLLFAWKIVQFVKSNAIVYAKDQMTLGIGAGQTSRVFSAQIAILQAEQNHLDLSHSVMASDAFFPFADGIEVAIKAGITAIIQPGGSKRDNEVIAAADKAGIAMIFTHMRHFRH